MEEDYKIIDNVIYTPEIKDQPDGRGIGWVYYEGMLKYRNRVAQIDGLTGETDSFGALLLRCVRAAIGLKAKGVQYGDVVSVCTKNHLNSCVPHISSMFVGAKIAALDPSLTVRDAAHLFKIVMPKIIFVEEESVALIENVINEVGATTTIVVFGSTDKHESFLDFAKPNSEEIKFQPVTAKDMKDVAVIMFSSGTSGFPKGVCHTHFSILRNSSNAMLLGSFSAITYASDSPYWNVFLFYLNHSLQNGNARLIYPKFDLANPWSIFRHNITMAFLNVTELMTLCNTPKPHSIDTTSIKLISTAGGPINVQQIQKGRSCFPNTCTEKEYKTATKTRKKCCKKSVTKNCNLQKETSKRIGQKNV
ncbi:hypothetical protein FQR65_LT04877 [Abscondita terminalis]|nr:hypothetical protein FQR65_LT04877 [Abscondita terminalis]